LISYSLHFSNAAIHAKRLLLSLHISKTLVLPASTSLSTQPSRSATPSSDVRQSQ